VCFWRWFWLLIFSWSIGWWLRSIWRNRLGRGLSLWSTSWWPPIHLF
jgi:hypothetical protein